MAGIAAIQTDEINENITVKTNLSGNTPPTRVEIKNARDGEPALIEFDRNGNVTGVDNKGNKVEVPNVVEVGNGVTISFVPLDGSITVTDQSAGVGGVGTSTIIEANGKVTKGTFEIKDETLKDTERRNDIYKYPDGKSGLNSVQDAATSELDEIIKKHIEKPVEKDGKDFKTLLEQGGFNLDDKQSTDVSEIKDKSAPKKIASAGIGGIS